MNLPNDEYREMAKRLDEAGEFWRPRHPGWSTLLQRLPPHRPAEAGEDANRPPAAPGIRASVPWKTLAVAASVLVAAALGIFLLFGPEAPARAGPLPVEVQRLGIEVTVFSAADRPEPTLYMAATNNPARASAGMALVKDRRMILHLQRGDNLVKFTDVAATIDPTSVRLQSETDPAGMKVVEQNFEFDLAGGDALLKRSIGQKITCVGKEGGRPSEGYLVSYDEKSIVLADRRPSDDPRAERPKTQTLARDKLQAIRLKHKPAELYTRPTLVWKLRARKPGDHRTTLTYVCGDAVWRADYVAVITGSQGSRDTLELKAWVTIDNRSGTTYRDAGLKLIAGDVHRVRDPWAPRPPSRKDFYPYDIEAALGLFAPKQFAVRELFEYKLYALDQPSTIKDRQIKQIGLFRAAGVKARRRYICRTHPTNLYCALERAPAEVRLLVKNEKQNRLGRPLPKGTIRLMAPDADGAVQLLGRDEIDHTPKDEELELEMGRAFDVVYDYRITATWHAAERHMFQTYELRIRNHKSHEIPVRVVGRLLEEKNWKVVDSTDEVVRHDHKTVYVEVPLGADSEKTVRYTVEYQW